jgi:indolepyruvate ferredoxin oxidoreductase
MLSAYTLDQRYDLDAERAFLTGMQALTRLPLMQRQRDVASGLSTAGYVTGYQGSPLATVDLTMASAAAALHAAHVVVQPAVNEELAASAVLGTQQVPLDPAARYDGVFGMWYGKAPGVDRAADALNICNHSGVAPHGGVLVLAGDDPGGKSSSVPNDSEHVLVHCKLPILSPHGVQEYLDMGILGWAMSRYSGSWVSMRCLTDTASSSAAVDARWDRLDLRVPADEFDPDRWIKWDRPKPQYERLVRTVRLPAAQAFARANRLDRVVLGDPRTLAVVASGETLGDVLEAFEQLGVDDRRARELGVGVFKVGLVWPLEPTAIIELAESAAEILVVEEKTGLIESQIASILYNASRRPALSGKLNVSGEPQFPTYGEIGADQIARVLAGRLGLAVHERNRARSPLPLTALTRQPTFCAGCPHSASTKVPDGSIAHGGIGCHAMALWLPEPRALSKMQMGGEGANWIGTSPFTDTKHVFQNMGDGTYVHSGSLSIRGAVAAGVSITYKILANGAVAMTGGQALEGHELLGQAELVESIVRQVSAEGVRRIAVVSDDPRRYRRRQRRRFPAGTTVHDRARLDEVQIELRDTPGVTALIFDQSCAAEARRLRKRGVIATPTARVAINDRVCEGCGDCNYQSSCVAVEPYETSRGRKRRINQDGCNIDTSCVQGYCPSFATVENAVLRKPVAKVAAVDRVSADLPAPTERAADSVVNVLVAGVGGTGVVTVGALLGTAAFLEGKASSVLDLMGLSQKGGPVTSHVRIGPAGSEVGGLRIAAASVDVLLGADLVTSTSDEVADMLAAGRTVAVVSTDVQPTAQLAADPDLDLRSAPLLSRLGAAIGLDRVERLDAVSLARSALGDEVAANTVMLGYALQRGLLPVSLGGVVRAIELNKVKVELNRRALDLGRALAARPDEVLAVLADESAPQDLGDPTDEFAADLAGYQSRRYAESYCGLVRRTADAETLAVGGPAELTAAVTRNLHKVMAYKDEYEVARLWTDKAAIARITEQFEPGARLRVNLAPQILWPKDRRTGRPSKARFGPWIFPVFRILAAMKFLRGSLLDPFGWTSHRRRERELRDVYMAVVDHLVAQITAGAIELPDAVRIAAVPDDVRGFGDIKDGPMDKAVARLRDYLAADDPVVSGTDRSA